VRKKTCHCGEVAVYRYKADGAPQAFACRIEQHRAIAKARAQSMCTVVSTESGYGFTQTGRVADRP
jgi:hypothetical protein